MKVIYTGTLPNVKVKFVDGSDKKISRGETIDVSEMDWARMSATGNFELVTEVNENIKKKSRRE